MTPCEPDMLTTITESGWIVESLDRASAEAKELAARFAADPYAALFTLGFFPDHPPWYDNALVFLSDISRAFCTALLDHSDLELLRQEITVELDEDVYRDLMDRMPFFIGSRYVNRSWLENVWNRLLAVYRTEIAGYTGTVEACLSRFAPGLKVPERVYFHLVENKADESHPFAFLATYATTVNRSVRHMPLRHALTEYRDDQNQLIALLSSLSRAAEHSALLQSLMESGELLHPVAFTASDALAFLQDVCVFEQANIVCRIPKWWKKPSRFSISLDSPRPKGQAVMGLDTLLEFTPSLMFDGVPVSPEELQDLARRSEGLAMLKGRWVAVDHDQLHHVLDAFGKASELASSGGCTLLEALRMQATDREASPRQNDVPVSLSVASWTDRLAKLAEKTFHPWPDGGSPTCFATLRPYQIEGYTYLDRMHGMGLGCCLADDMGLGKTVQTLALLDMLHRDGPLHALLVVPASCWKTGTRKRCGSSPGCPTTNSTERRRHWPVSTSRLTAST